MTLRDLISSACAGLLQQKLRTLLTLAGVALGAMLLFCCVSGGLGVLDALGRRLSIGDRLLTIRVSAGMKSPPKSLTNQFAAGIPDSVSDERRQRLAETMALRSGRGKTVIPLTLGDLPELREMNGVRSVTPVLSWRSGVLLDGNELSRVSVKAVRAESESINGLIVFGSALSGDSANEVLLGESFLFSRGFQSDSVLKFLIGKPLSIVHSRSGRLSGDAVASLRQSLQLREQTLSADELPEAQRVILEEEIVQKKRQLDAHERAVSGVVRSPELKIVGIYRSPTADGFQADSQLVDAFYSHALVPVDTAVGHWEKCFPADRSVVATVKATDAGVAKEVLETLRGRGLRCDSLADIARRIRSAVLMVSAVITAIAAGAFFIAALGMANTMIMNVLERRREIGILKSIGARDRDVLRMFLVEGLLVGLLGGVVGLVLGLTVMHLSEGYLQSFLESRLDEPFEGALFVQPVWLLVATPIIAGLVTTIASLVPARRAAKLDPVETLRAL